jgi:hypothetical protein
MPGRATKPSVTKSTPSKTKPVPDAGGQQPQFATSGRISAIALRMRKTAVPLGRGGR